MSYSPGSGGQYKADHPERAREYQRRDNAKRTRAKHEWVRANFRCSVCGGPMGDRRSKRCRECSVRGTMS